MSASVRRAHHGGELALQRAHRRARRLARAGIDQVRDRLRLGKVELVVEEGALGELARLRAARAEFEGALHQCLEHHRAAVALQLEYVLAGIGVRGRKVQHEPGIERARPRASRKRVNVARRAGGSSPRRTVPICGAFGPEMRTMPMPPRPGGVAAATMVSVRVMNRLCRSVRLLPRPAAREAPRPEAGARHRQLARLAAATASMRRLMFHCWAMESTVLVTQ